MRLSKSIQGIFLLLIMSCQAQDYGKLEIITTMPSTLYENSGIAFIPNTALLYATNDSGNKSVIYGLDLNTGDIITASSIENIKNDDWEDLTSDTENLYIGDFGNNKNKRKKHHIYWIPNGLLSTKTIQESEIVETQFTLEDQEDFPPKKKDRNFDIESFFVFDDHFYLFTRNRSSKFDGTTKLYKIPKSPGKQEAKVVGTFKTCDDKSTCQVTSAAIHTSTGKVALLTYDKVFIFTDYKDDHFFEGTVTMIPVGHESQKEAIVFKDENTLIITEENNSSSAGGNIYELSITQ